MARTLIPTKRVTIAGVTWVAADLVTPDLVNGNYALNDGQTYLLLVPDANARSVTVTTPTTYGSFAVADPVLAVAASQSGMFGPFPTPQFGPQLLLDFSNALLKCLVLSLLPEVRS